MLMHAWKVTAFATRNAIKRGRLQGPLKAAFQLHARRALPRKPAADGHHLRNLSGSPFKHCGLFLLRLWNIHPQGLRNVRRRLGHAAASSRGEQDSIAPMAAQRSLTARLLQLLKRVAKVLAGLALVALLAAAALPSILSTGPGLQAGTAMASRFLPASVCVQQADLGWNKRIKLSGVEFKSPAILGGETLASVETVITTESLWNVVRGRSFDAFASRPRVDCSLASSGQLKWAELLDYAAGKAALPAKLSGAITDSVEVAKAAELPFTAEGRFLSGSLYVSDGILTLPRELKEVLGRDLHLTAVVGANNLHASADELSLDTAWVRTDTPAVSLARHQGQCSPEAARQRLPASKEQPSTPGEAEGGGAGRVALSLSKSWPLDPTIIAIRSEHMDFEAAGWRRADGRLLLRRPATAQLKFTSALAEFGLARVSPLLSGVLAVEEGTVGLTVAPAGMVAPAESYHLRIAPLRVAVSRQDLLARAIQFLRLKEGGEIAQKSLLQGMTSAVRVDLSETGVIRSERVDLLVSPGGRTKGVHLCTWGRVDPVSSSLDIALGVPADTLKLVGLKHVDRGAMLVIPVRGTSSSPRVDWVEAYKRLAALAAEQQGAPKNLQGRLLQGIVQGLNLRANPGLAQDGEVPVPVEVLPWEEDSQVLHSAEVKVDSSTVADAVHM